MNRQELNIALYRKLYLIRAAESSIRENYRTDMMKTPMHMSTGEEAIPSGVCQALAASDQVLGTYRSHGLYLAKTGETDRFFAEMYGKATGMAKGKGGSMHLTAPAEGLICTSAIVATTIPVAIGAAFANKSRANGRLVAVFFGDGSVDEGVFWESLNSACSMKLPVLFVCEDNGYAVHSPVVERHGYDSIAEIASKFHCDVFCEDTTDAEVIHELARRAVDSVHARGRPAFLYFKYYRHLEHVGINEDFDQGYRSREEYESWAKIDPVKVMREKLFQWLTEPEIAAIERSIAAQIYESVSKAIDAPFPPNAELYEDMLA
ncbi:MAG: thiamine pyrophosphate-dependent dehydrogenase E1 component subunit alpha [Patescibacteria group bacterium]